MRILALEPYLALSHRNLLEGLARHSAHSIEIDSLPARKWKWRMRTASLHYARRLAERRDVDLLFVSDYLNLAELRPLLPPALQLVPAVLYFHENQLTYPLQEGERRDLHFALTHVHAALCAERVLFNSEFHRRSFLGALSPLLAGVPDTELGWVCDEIEARSRVLPLGTDLPPWPPAPPCTSPVVLCNQRWEYDKNPRGLLEALVELDRRGADFRIRILGEQFRERPRELEELRERLGQRLVAAGFLPDRDDYVTALSSCHVVLSTAWHEFFGLGTLEALRRGLLPVLPADLAYPELLPPAERSTGRFLYDRDPGPVECLARAVEAVRSGDWMEERTALARFTDGFAFEHLAPRYDRLFEEVRTEGVRKNGLGG